VIGHRQAIIYTGIQRLQAGLKKPGFFQKAKTQWVFWFFLDKQEKIGKIIQKLSNLKP